MPDAAVLALAFVDWVLLVVVLLKGRGWIALATFVVSGVPVVGLPVAVVLNGAGAARLALPDSHWARARYGREQRRRARHRHPDAPTEPDDKYRALAALATVVYAVAVYAAAFG